MESDFDPPVCSIEGLRPEQVDELYRTLEPNFKNNGGLLRERTPAEILHDIHEYYVVRINNTLAGTFHLRKSMTRERFLELGAFLVCAEKSHREGVKDDIIEFSRNEAKRKCLELISLTSHPSLQNFYHSVGAKLQDADVYPIRRKISPGVPLYSFEEN